MAEVDIAGLGVWSQNFADWPAFRTGLKTGEWSTDVALQPALIPPRQRRRMPQLVKMAIEVMDQACTMASLKADDVAVVFSSSMGDMQITDYMCRILATTPELISPTHFHNSVHNAAPGYWSITTGSFAPTTAVSAHEFTPTMAFLEAAIQVIEENTPVVLVTQEIAAPLPLKDICASLHPFSAALLMTPPGYGIPIACSLEFSVSEQAESWPELHPALRDDFATNTGARILPLLTAIAGSTQPVDLSFPVSASSSLILSLNPDCHNVE